MGDFGVTSTAFLGTVTEAEPFRFQSLHAQVRSALRITHIVYQPAAPVAKHDDVAGAFAQIRSLCGPSGKVETFTVAGFRAQPSVSSGSAVAVTHPSHIASGLNIQIDVDEYTELVMVGKGTLLYFGEQFSQLIDEEQNHHMFDDEEDDAFDDEMFNLIHGGGRRGDVDGSGDEDEEYDDEEWLDDEEEEDEVLSDE